MLHALVCRVLVHSRLLLVFPKKLGFKNRRKVTSVQDVKPPRLACIYVPFKLLVKVVSLLLVFLALALALAELVQSRPGWIERIHSSSVFYTDWLSTTHRSISSSFALSAPLSILMLLGTLLQGLSACSICCSLQYAM